MQSNEVKEALTSKTWKREVAAILFTYWMVYLVPYQPETLDVVTFPIFTFGALAFGIDWWGKSNGMQRNSGPQSSHRGRSERSSEYSSGQEQPTDHWHIDR